MSEIAKVYEPRDVEARWYAEWLEAGCFKARVDPEREPYSIMIPPPNVTGLLHMGHVLDNTLQDIFVRRARLEGKAVLWQPGTDHAGIATQTKVERQLRESTGETKYDLGREAFLEKVWKFRETSGDAILQQLQKLGASCDWDRTHFTLDEEYSKAVLTAFVRLHQRGYIYRGKRMINWCPATQTAISDEEVKMAPTQGILYKMRYELVEPDGERSHLEISTTRPETLMGDTAVAVHPEDARYRHLIGKSVWRPFPREMIPIIGDEYVDREFGTGCLKVTPAHDRNDFEIGIRHGLETLEVIGPDGRITEAGGADLAGMDREEAREKAAAKLDAMGLLIDREPYENTVGFSERGDVPIEPRLSEQWFLRYPKVREAKRAVETGIIRFHPDRWKKTYLNWLNGIQDWCISRQLWWGHRIPVWYKKGLDRSELDFQNPEHVHVSVEGPPDPENWEQEEDVLDTWASSYLWPMANLGWPDPDEEQQRELAFWYPTTVLVTGFDIIFFWVARMIMAGLELYGEDAPKLSDEEIARRVPFKNVFIHGLIRDAQGYKMSKSRGNSPDPHALIERFGADGLRFGICNIAPSGSDILFSEERIQVGRNFCNKLWNAARFRQMSQQDGDGELGESNRELQSIASRIEPKHCDDYDHWILARLLEVSGELEDCFANFETTSLTQLIHRFFWSDFCDWYVEVSKDKLQGGSGARKTCLAIQDLVIRQVLQLAHPILPHITEELWHALGYQGESGFIQDTRIVRADELKAALGASNLRLDASAVRRVGQLCEAISQARSLKAEYNLANKRDVVVYYASEEKSRAVIESNAAVVRRLGGIGTLAAVNDAPPEGLPAVVTPLGTLYLDLSSSIDVEAEKARLSKELEKLNQLVAVGEKKLNDPKFMANAPGKVVEGARTQLAETTEKRDETKRILENLGA
ncbi:MAG: valine--tRNA ligase [Opitutales bacterium]